MFSHLKRRIGVISAIAVLAALVPALAASSVSAAPATTAIGPSTAASGVETYSACPASASTAAAGFTDTTSTDVDCIASYGITTGVTATTYEPSSNIPRWQMALYMTRTATVAGHTLGSGADQGFTDIGGYSAAIQTAINQLKQLGVTAGTTATTYSPDDNVSREQMAMFVNRLLRKTAVGPNGAAVSSTDGYTSNIGLTAADSYNYTDIDGASVTFEGHNAIEENYNLGIPGHAKTVTTFGPATSITRDEMATWLTNALGHTNARPAGINIEYATKSGYSNSTPGIAVTYRDSAFQAVAGQAVDMFQWTTSATLGNTQAWSSTGTCNLNTNVTILGNSLTKCTIDVGDPATNSAGNIAPTSPTQAAGKSLNIYAWTGTAGTKYDNDTLSASLSTDAATTATSAPILLVTCDVNAKAETNDMGAGQDDVAQLHHGSTVTMTAQMATTYTGSLSYIPVAEALNKVKFSHTIYAPGDASDTVIVSITSTSVYTDASGTATYSFTQADPNSDADAVIVDELEDDTLHVITVSDAATSTTSVSNNVADGKPCHMDAASMSFQFRDTYTDAAYTLKNAPNVTSYLAAAAVTSPISRSATATVTDAFGDAFSGSTVVFHGGNTTVPTAEASMASDDFITAVGISAKVAPLDAICFTAVAGATAAFTLGGTAVDVGTVYYVATDSGANVISIAETATTTTGALVGGIDITDLIALAHPTAGCGKRTTGYDGTAGIAWNDTALTSAADTMVATILAACPGAADNECGTAVAASANATSYRYLAPNATILATAKSSTGWVELNDDQATTDDAAEIMGTPIVVDTVGNTMVVKLNYGASGTDTYTKYSWDSNDHFYIGSANGAAGTPVTEAVFEGSFMDSSISGTKGLMNSLADNNNGLTWKVGDLDGVSYAALSGNISVFFVGA